MKQFIFIFMVMTALSAVGQHPVLEIGAKMPSCDENMQCATSGKTFQLDDLFSPAIPVRLFWLGKTVTLWLQNWQRRIRWDSH